MKTMRLFPLELKRLLQSRLTWLMMALTVLSPVLGLVLYKPATSTTMLSMYLDGQAAHFQKSGVQLIAPDNLQVGHPIGEKQEKRRDQKDDDSHNCFNRTFFHFASPLPADCCLALPMPIILSTSSSSTMAS